MEFRNFQTSHLKQKFLIMAFIKGFKETWYSLILIKWEFGVWDPDTDSFQSSLDDFTLHQGLKNYWLKTVGLIFCQVIFILFHHFPNTLEIFISVVSNYPVVGFTTLNRQWIMD